MEDSSLDRSPFINTRCRLQRMKDAKFFAGWVKDLTAHEVQLKLSTKTGLIQGDDFSVEIHGLERTAIFNAKLCGQDGDEVMFRIDNKINYMPSRERARLRVEGIGGTFTYEGFESTFTVADVSMQGCGIVVANTVARGTKLELSIDTPQGLIFCVGEVRYSKPDPNVPGAFRLGVLLCGLGRLEAARWHKLFEFYSAA